LQKKLYQEQDAFNALIAGEEGGFDYYFNHYYSPLVFYCTKLTNNRESAKDIVVEAFIKLWKNKESITEYCKVKPLLYRTVYNASIDYLRKQKTREQAISILSSDGQFIQGNILEKLIETETYQHLYSLLSTLPFKCRQIFQMFYFQDKPIKEIAEELGISVNTVKSQKQRAIQLLKERQALISFVTTFLLIIFQS
jgi:RNA polymerase sigma-70 factor (ECF subfamily)